MIELIFFVLAFLYIWTARFDVFLLSFAGLFLYFLPFFVGAIYHVDSSGSLIKDSPSDFDQKIQLSVISSLFLLTISRELFYKYKIEMKTVIYLSNLKFFTYIFLVVSLFLMLYGFSLVGLYAHKSEYSKAMGYLFGFMHYFVSVSVVLTFYYFFFYKKNYLILFSGIFLVLLSIFVYNTRSFFFFSFLALIFYWLEGKKLKFFFLNKNLYFILIGFIVFLSSKHISNYVLHGISYNNILLVLIDAFEPVVVASYLNVVLNSNFSFFMFDEIFLSVIPFFSIHDYHEVVR